MQLKFIKALKKIFFSLIKKRHLSENKKHV